MDGAGTIFDRLEQKLSALGVNADIGGLQKAAADYDARIGNDPADLESKRVGLELKVVMLARLLNATIDVLEAQAIGDAPAAAAAPQHAAAPAATATVTAGPVRKIKRLRQNPATGIIEEIEDIAEDNVIVADNRSRFQGSAKKDEKRPVFIQATDDEPVAAAEKAKK